MRRLRATALTQEDTTSKRVAVKVPLSGKTTDKPPHRSGCATAGYARGGGPACQ